MVKMCSRNRRAWSLEDSYDFIAKFLHEPKAFQSHGPLLQPVIQNRPLCTTPLANTYRTRLGGPSLIHSRRAYRAREATQKRQFHDYFVTNLPSSSLHPDSRSSGPHHKLPRAASTPDSSPSKRLPAAAPTQVGASRELTVVRIPLRSAKHHFGVSVSRGTRPYNEDTYQAGTIEIPAFAKKAPISLSRRGGKFVVPGATSADSASGDPQVFYFGVFDGHGGNECSDFLREDLHLYLESAAKDFQLGSSLKKKITEEDVEERPKRVEISSSTKEPAKLELDGKGNPKAAALPTMESEPPSPAQADTSKSTSMQQSLVAEWKETVGGYFRRFQPAHFFDTVSLETVLMYAFLRADLDFVLAQARKPDPNNNTSDSPLNADDVLGSPSKLLSHQIGGPNRFVGGSTGSIALISTPTPTPFWHPASPSTMIVAHVGDTRILLCDTATGAARPVTTNHHPSAPIEAARLRRYAATFVTDSFGEERMAGLANTRAFGDMRSKRIGVSAEPEIRRIELGPAEYSFLVLASDGVTGTLSDQEIMDVVKEAKTPEQGARDVVSFATEVGKGEDGGDNATCLVVRLGGWERRIEGGMGSLGTKEMREFRKSKAEDVRPSR